jgi:hypothetical protein
MENENYKLLMRILIIFVILLSIISAHSRLIQYSVNVSMVTNYLLVVSIITTLLVYTSNKKFKK